MFAIYIYIYPRERPVLNGALSCCQDPWVSSTHVAYFVWLFCLVYRELFSSSCALPLPDSNGDLKLEADARGRAEPEVDAHGRTGTVLKPDRSVFVRYSPDGWSV